MYIVSDFNASSIASLPVIYLLDSKESNVLLGSLMWAVLLLYITVLIVFFVKVTDDKVDLWLRIKSVFIDMSSFLILSHLSLVCLYIYSLYDHIAIYYLSIIVNVVIIIVVLASIFAIFEISALEKLIGAILGPFFEIFDLKYFIHIYLIASMILSGCMIVDCKFKLCVALMLFGLIIWSVYIFVLYKASDDLQKEIDKNRLMWPKTWLESAVTKRNSLLWKIGGCLIVCIMLVISVFVNYNADTKLDNENFNDGFDNNEDLDEDLDDEIRPLNQLKIKEESTNGEIRKNRGLNF
jgi:hypothetical protein